MEINMFFLWINFMSVFSVIYSQNGDVPVGAASLAFVFDITGSMDDDLLQVIDGAEKIMQMTQARTVNPLYNYILVPFHDPDIGPVIETRDPEEFIYELEDLYVHGGGDCPEMSVGAIKEALDTALPNSFIYVFTDARSKDYVLTEEVLSLIQQKQSQVVFVMTGDCGNQTHEGFQAYEKIASTSSGQVFLLNKDQVNQVLDFVKLTVQAQKVNLMSIDSPTKSTDTYIIPVDNKLQEFTVSVSGRDPEIKLWSPGQDNEFTEHDGLGNLLDLKKVKIQNVRDPEMGKWKLEVFSNSSHTVRVHGLSSTNFMVGFSRKPVKDIASTSLRPIKGVESYGLVNTTDMNFPAQLYKMELLDLQGDVLREYPLVRDKLRDNIYTFTRFIPPDSYFYIKVSGIDDYGNTLERLTATAISSREPTNPVVYMPDVTRGYYGVSAFLTCTVISETSFTVQWIKKNKPFGKEHYFSESSNVTLEVPNATEKSEGLYVCNATNKASWRTALTFLDISEPPPIIVRPQNTSALPGEDAILSCSVSSTVEHNVTWYKVGQNSQLTTNRKYQLLSNGSIIIRNVDSEDGGKYVCRAGNEGGFTKDSVHLIIQIPPEMSIDPPKQDFMAGEMVSFLCAGKGHPSPAYYWLRDGELLIPNNRVKIFGPKLVLSQLEREDNGYYQCLAKNAAGENVAVAQLNYIEKPEITMYNKDVMVAEGDPASLKCSSTGIPPPVITWYKGDVELTALSYVILSKDGELMILGVQQQDVGEYRCVATNRAGSDSITTNLKVGSEPRITAPPQNTGADIGTNATLTCRAQGIPVPEISWKFSGQPIDIGGRIQMLPSGELFIQRVGLEDKGPYTCVVRNKFGTREHTAFLSITGIMRPVIAHTLPFIDVVKGKNVSMNCILIQGNPKPKVDWFYQGHVINESSHFKVDSGKVLITNIQKQHEGEYTCVASNIAGNATSAVSVNVQVPPSLDTDNVENKQPNFTVNLGSGIVLPCKVDGDPPPTILWYKDGSPISLTDLHYFVRQDGSLEIFSSDQRDGGEYRCIASNVAGNVEKTISLFVQVPPSIDGDLTENYKVLVGESVSLDCIAEGIPRPTVIWRRDAKDFHPKSSRFSIDEFGMKIARVKTNDKAVYECVAKNTAGEVTKVITLDVQAPPTISDEEASTITSLEGSNVTLNCESDGDPVPIITWKKDGVTIDTESSQYQVLESGSLTIHQISVEDGGNYVCEAVNEAGKAQKEFDLTVHGPPKLLQKLPPRTEVIEGEPVTLVCPVSGTPTPSIHWYKDDKLLNDSDSGFDILLDGSLVIDSTRASDAGVYRCHAVNVAGSVERFVDLGVNVPPSVKNGDGESNRPNVILNQNITLTCPVDGVPPPSVTWYKDGHTVSTDDQYSVSVDGTALSVIFARISDAGRYKCIATNKAGQTEINFDLDVFVPPQIDPTASSESNLTVIIDQNLIVNCPISGFPLPDIRWFKDGQITSPDGHVTISANGRRLSINSSRADDSGDYRCEGRNVGGETEKTFSVRVLEPPSVDSPGEIIPVEVKLGSTLLIVCPATGIPPPKITWFADSQPLKNNTDRLSLLDNDWTLEVRNVQRSDAIRYICKAKNEAGQSEKGFDVNVLLPSEIIREKLDLDPKVILDRSLTLSCPVQGNPLPLITWYKNGDLIDFDSSQMYERLSEGRQLHIISASTSDIAIFSCEARNKVGDDSADFDVNVLLPARINMTGIQSKQKVLSGTPLILTCPAVGMPPPNITWYQNGELLTEMTDKLIIKNTNVRHAGRYKCVVSNIAGEEELEYEVKVHVPPSIDITGINTKPQIITGQPATLTCPAQGTPPPDITWYKDGLPIDFKSEQLLTLLANGKQLHFKEVNVQNGGKYKCVANSDAGKTEQEFDLDVLVPPKMDDRMVNSVTKVMKGHSTVIECPVTGTPAPMIDWYKDGRLMIFGDRVQLENNGQTLNIINTLVEDTANYTCSASNIAGTASHDIGLVVLVPPSIDESNLVFDRRVRVNRTVLLECPVEGIPPPKVTWFVDNIPLVETDRRQLLDNNRQVKIRRSQLEDSATYTCQAVNEVGDLSKKFKLSVLLPSEVDRKNLKTSFTVIQNQTVYIDCPVTGIPKPSITWMKENIPLTEIPYQDVRVVDQGQRLEVRQAQIDDAGRYTCKASNLAGSDSQQFVLEVQVPPEITGAGSTSKSTVIIGEPVNLECIVDGLPPPEVRWFKDNSPIDLSENQHIRIMTGGQVLQLVSSRVEDKGRYTCKANNSAGRREKYFDLDILVPPKIIGSDNIQKHTAVLNHQHILDCPASGIPPPKITWKFRNEIIPAYGNPTYRLLNNGRQLLLINTQLLDAGFYSCIVSNDAGTTTLDFQLDVMVPPSISTGPRHVSSEVNSRVRLRCEADGLPRPVVTWEKDGKEFPTIGLRHLMINQGSLEFTSVQLEDTGDYSCHASNPAGNATYDVHLSIQVRPRMKTQGPTQLSAVTGQSIDLPCDVEAHPPPQIMWQSGASIVAEFPNESPNIPQNRNYQIINNSTLRILKTSVEDSGVYICIARNSAGTAFSQIQLQILVPPKITAGDSEFLVQEGRDIVLPCRVGGEPAPQITWEKDGRVLSGSDYHYRVLSSGNLAIPYTRQEDGGNYTCRAVNEAGEDRVNISLIVQVPPTITRDNSLLTSTVGKSVLIPCQASGIPDPLITWLKDGKQIESHNIKYSIETNGSLVVNDLQAEDTGSYKCMATNVVGRDFFDRTLRVQVPPTIIQRHVDTMVATNDRLVLTCTAAGTPMPSISWTKNGEPVSSGPSYQGFSRLVIWNAIKQDAGIYTCTAKNPAGIASVAAMVVIKVDGNWGEWSEWAPCSQSCGRGSSKRTRLCDSPLPEGGGLPCQGSDEQEDFCNQEPCPVNGNWSPWGDLGECSASCDGGFRKRFRTCTDPPPLHNGRFCTGPSEETESCNSEACPVHGDWTEWGSWSDCSQTCDKGGKERYRVCNIPLFGGLPCIGDRKQVADCVLEPCSKMPRKAIGNLVGYISNIDITEGKIVASLSPTSDGTIVNASIENIPTQVSSHLQHLISILNPVYWTSAQETDGASNGFRLTDGEFSRDTQVQFATGEILKMSHYVSGVDSDGSLQFDVIVRGSVPDLPDNAIVDLYPYTEQYIQTGPGSIYSYSSRLMRVNGHMLPYAWNHTISYNSSHGVMPFLVEQLHNKDIEVMKDPNGRRIKFSFRSEISPGSTRDQCPTGFTLNTDGSFCSDEDECVTTQPCSHYCHNSPGKFSCSCMAGYSLDRDGKTCIDIDECSSNNGACREDQDCVNTDGRFYCAIKCKDGYRRSRDGEKCLDKDECRETPLVCEQYCQNILGGYTCSCGEGFQLRPDRSGRCTDVNECRTGKSSCSHICRNTIGRYRCDCPAGYRLYRKYHCEDIDECLEATHECGPDKDCINTVGSYECKTRCSKGYHLQSDGSCADINECLNNQHRCYSNQRCVNTEGSYYCQCQQGYISRGPAQPCLDINECLQDVGVCQHNCTNTVGSFYCSCPLGYKLSRDNRKCVDINECLEQDIQCGSERMCFNQRGDFSCIEIPCPRDYRRDPLTNYCVLECVDSSLPCPPNAKFADVIEFRTLALPSGMLTHQDLIRLVAYNHLQEKLPRTNFTIMVNDPKINFQLRLDDGSGIVYTLRPLEEKTTYKITVRARSYDNNENSLRYQTTFIIHISVSAYPY